MLKTYSVSFPIWGKRRFSDWPRIMVYEYVFRRRSIRYQKAGMSVACAAEKAGCARHPKEVILGALPTWLRRIVVRLIYKPFPGKDA